MLHFLNKNQPYSSSGSINMSCWLKYDCHIRGKWSKWLLCPKYMSPRPPRPGASAGRGGPLWPDGEAADLGHNSPNSQWFNCVHNFIELNGKPCDKNASECVQVMDWLGKMIDLPPHFLHSTTGSLGGGMYTCLEALTVSWCQAWSRLRPASLRLFVCWLAGRRPSRDTRYIREG